MMKKLICLGVVGMLVISLSACGESAKVKEYDKEKDFEVKQSNQELEITKGNVEEQEVLKNEKNDSLNVDNELSNVQGINFVQFDTMFYPVESLALEWRESDKIKNYKDFEYDLDGDGEVDKITIRAKEEQLWNGLYHTVHVYELNGVEFDDVGNFGEIYIVDLNKNDNSIEVVTWDNGPSDDSVYNIYSKQNGKMKCILNEWTGNMYIDQLGKVLPSGHFKPSIYKKYYSFINGELKTIELDIDTISSIEFDASEMYFSIERENLTNVCSKYYEIGEVSSFTNAFEKALEECNVEQLSGGTFKILEIADEDFYRVYVQLDDGRKGYVKEYIQLAD